MIVDANILLYAVDSRSPRHDAASEWLTIALRGDRRVALPWQTIGAFVRIITHPRVTESPLTGPDAWRFVQDWLAVPVCWIPPATDRTARTLGTLIERHGLSGNAIPDAQLAALAIEHGVSVVSNDSDFARFPEVAWENPLA
ncbi:TA system VapC family ribonuclease toxin [Solicola gregarius]|uniref:Ribonuclease VapC n=1 Tax=Solicola gregarius TaxID=2908642 RepID=A0AA46TI54_9ACTN|nr:TA system VapC family ribonuclease toxin [Solicola gregarius]UYM05267.1 PIN domain-containing protein [Solicola gregarius]